jgi:hypothetical protein
MINGATRKMWVERYAEPGEFELVAPLRSNLRQFLPIGTLISHLQTQETMIVENIEVSLNLKEDSQLKITGRSLVAYLEQRLIGVNLVRASSTISEYILASDETWHQIVTMINDHIGAPAVADDEIPLIEASTDLTTGGTSEARTISPGDILAPVLELLDIDDCGIRSSRSTSSEIFTLDVYKGADHTKDVIFSWTADDLTASGYLFTNKKLKTTAMVVGQYVWTMVDTAGYTGHKRRMMIVDASDIDGHLDTAPTGGTLTSIISKMQARGRQKLKSQRDLNITNAEISNLSSYEYRQDYRLGDLVMIEGDFNQQEVKRVTEYAEIEDETGYTSHPTLSDPFDEEE